MPWLITRTKDEEFHRKFTTMLSPPPEEHRLKVQGEYKYEFQPPPAQKDPVIRLIIRTIRELEKDDIAVAAASIRVWNSTSGPPIWPPTPYGINSKFYTFKEWYQEFPITVPVVIVHKPGPLSADMLHVRWWGTLKPLKQWLTELPDRGMLLKDRMGINSQQNWWRKNGMVFRLMDLAKELRILVYQQAIGPVYPLSQITSFETGREVSARQQARLVFGVGYSHKLLRDCRMSDSPYSYLHGNGSYTPESRPDIEPNLNILYTSRQIYNEAIPGVWNGTRKYFFESRLFMNVCEARHGPGPASIFNCLSRIQLNFTHYQYFEFFGVKIHPYFHLDPSKTRSHYLTDLPQLEDLQLRFRHPFDGHGGSPWLDNPSINHTGCQKTMVDWIITFAFPTIKDIKKVTFTGYVKTCTKIKWDYILKCAREGDLRGYDLEAELQAIFSTPQALLPPLCFCTQSCKCTRLSRYCIGYLDEWMASNDFDFDDVAEAPEYLQHHLISGW